MNHDLHDFGVYNYIVVGGGTAGCVLANRLSADPACSVLLLEAGERARSVWLDIPLGILKVLNNPRFDWCYQSEPELALDGRRIPVPRGRGLGGSTLINGMVYVRGQARDYDEWRDLGNPGWGWSDVLPWFKRSEDHARGADDCHGAGGEWRVEDPGVHWEILQAFGAAAAELGIPSVTDVNRGAGEGAGYFQYNMHRGARLTTARAFLDPAARRQNLRVLAGAAAQRVRLNGGQASGVEFLWSGRRWLARASAEVVLSAGAIASPQLLQASGVGPAPLLQRHGIPVLHHAPGVGENLQDHYQVRSMVRVCGTVTLNQRVRTRLGQAGAALQYALTRRGPLSTGAAQYFCFTCSHPSHTTPNLQYHVVPASYDSMGSDLHTQAGFIATVCNLRPQSRGHVRIASPDVAIAPAITQNFLSHEADRVVAVEGMHLTRRLLAAQALARFAPEELRPGPDVAGDAALLDYSRATGYSVFHPVGTCRMGCDDAAVVDAALRVRGVGGLRVVDASIMPTLVSGNTSAPVVMIAEKAAAMIIASRP